MSLINYKALKICTVLHKPLDKMCFLAKLVFLPNNIVLTLTVYLCVIPRNLGTTKPTELLGWQLI